MRICSLLPSGTEILFALGLGDQVIGVSDLCHYPPQVQEKPIVCRSRIDVDSMTSQQVETAMRRLQDAGESPYSLDQEWLARNPPDVVLTQDLCYFCEVDATTVATALRSVPSAPQVVVLNPRTLAQILDTIQEVGQACGASQAAVELVAALRQRVSVVTRQLETVRRRPRVFSLEGINPLVIGGHWIPDLLQLAGGHQGQFLPGCPAARVPWQIVVDSRPEKLFIDLCSSDLARSLREVPWLAALEGWRDLPAVRSGEVYLIDHVYFSSPGPRVVQGLEILAQLTHPDVFSGLVPPQAVAKLDADLAARCPAQDIARCFAPYFE